MTTLVDFRLATADTVMGRALETAPSLECELEGVVASAGHRLWVDGPDRSAVEAALDVDPTVARCERIGTGTDRWLYDAAFDADAGTVNPFEVIEEGGGTVLTASAADGTWSIQARFAGRDDVRLIYDAFADREVGTTVVRLQDLASDATTDGGLTSQQYETLETAIECGYFSIPREVSMQDLADELGVSHQALSERFRRAYRTLVAAELNVVDNATAADRARGD